jgi:hypothetical protein
VVVRVNRVDYVATAAERAFLVAKRDATGAPPPREPGN